LILSGNFVDLKESYKNENKRAFNAKFNSIVGLGRRTKKVLLEEWSNTP